MFKKKRTVVKFSFPRLLQAPAIYIHIPLLKNHLTPKHKAPIILFTFKSY